MKTACGIGAISYLREYHIFALHCGRNVPRGVGNFAEPEEIGHEYSAAPFSETTICCWAIESDRAYASGPRLARYLKRLIRKDAGDAAQRLELSQTELGNFAGMSREHINRQLRSWEESRIISLEQGRVRVLDPDMLEDISESEG